MPSSSLDALTPCLYSCAAFWVINTALRSKHKGHPLATWVIKIYEALKKLRALHLMSTQKFRSRYLWRGLKDRKVSHTPHIYILTLSETLTSVRAHAVSVTHARTHSTYKMILNYTIFLLSVSRRLCGLMRNSARMHVDLCFHTNYESTSY